MAINKTQQIAARNNEYSAEANNPPIGTVTSSFFIAMDDIFATSNVGSGSSAGASGLANAVHLLYYNSVEERPSIGTMTSDYQASATLVHSLLELHILTDSAMPTLRQNMRSNKPIAEMKLTRVGHLGEGADNTEMYSTTFTNNFIESIEEVPDKLILKVRVNTRSDTAASTDFTGAQATTSGSAASGWDYAQNAPMA